MSEQTIAPGSEVFAEPTYLPRIGNYDSRAVEQALAGATLFEPGVRLDAAVIEATYANREPPLLKRIREERVPYFLDLQALRFASPTFLEVGALAQLPYAPAQPLAPASASETDLRRLAHDALLFQQKVGARHYSAPALPVLDADSDGWMRLNRELLTAASQINGGPDVDRRPLTAVIAPGGKALSRPEAFLDWLLDVPIEAVYVQPLNLKPTTDSIEKLAHYVRFLDALRASGLTVIAGRVGAFGLLLQALGVADAFDSGLGDAEAYSYSQAIRPPTKPDTDSEKLKVGGRDMRIYLEPLKTTLPSKWATPILEQTGLPLSLHMCPRLLPAPRI